MKHYAGLDVSNAETSICIVDENNNIVKEAKVLSDPDCFWQSKIESQRD